MVIRCRKATDLLAEVVRQGMKADMCSSEYAGKGKEPELSIDTAVVECSLKELGEIRFVLVSGGPWEAVWNKLVRDHHYLGHR